MEDTFQNVQCPKFYRFQNSWEKYLVSKTESLILFSNLRANVRNLLSLISDELVQSQNWTTFDNT